MNFTLQTTVSFLNKSLDPSSFRRTCPYIGSPISLWTQVWRLWWVFSCHRYLSRIAGCRGDPWPRRLSAKWLSWKAPSSCSSWRGPTGGFSRRAPWLAGGIYAPSPALAPTILLTNRNYIKKCNISYIAYLA